MKTIESPIFGMTNILEEDDLADKDDLFNIRHLVEAFPINAFGILNKILNENGMCLQIAEGVRIQLDSR